MIKLIATVMAMITTMSTHTTMTMTRTLMLHNATTMPTK